MEKLDNVMDYDQFPRIIFQIMLNFNFWIVVFLTTVTCVSLRGYVFQQEALLLLDGVKSVPMRMERIVLLTSGSTVLLYMVFKTKAVTQAQMILKMVLELALAFVLCYALNFRYTGIVLLLLADLMQYPFSMRKRAGYVVFFCLVYYLLESAILKSWLKVTDISVYWGYYRKDVQDQLIEVTSILHLINIFLFILYMVTSLLAQMNEKEQILKLNEELTDANAQLERYAFEAERMAETRERNRLAREIHDTLGHSLTGIITGVEACIMLMDIAPEATKEQLRAIAEVARKGMTDVRASVKALRPDMLEQLSIGDALKKLIDDTSRSTGVNIDYLCETALDDLGQDEEDVVYRVIQESMTNAIRHGNADRIWIRIRREENRLLIRIQDNGKGDPEIKEGFGLNHMRERLEMLNGTLSYNGENGFLIEASLPIRWGQEQGEKKND